MDKKTYLLSHPLERTRHENPAKSEDSVTGPFSKDQLLSWMRKELGMGVFCSC
ncbi:hypothetical protein ACFOU2_01000 [Bacillus songklensis]|uniref:Uncharacterized protein n=1 Tax=Bacillus songklensis TaxID=1069116 RepID=A0ABV8AX14_9BACI